MSDDLQAILDGNATEDFNDSKVEETNSDNQLEDQQQEGETKENDEETPTSEKEDEPEQSEKDDSENWTKTAVIDERKKRQEAQRRIEELESELASFKNQTTQEEQKRPDVFEDQEAAFSSIEKSFEQKLFEAKVSFGREMLMEKHSDYLETIQEFQNIVKDNPTLLEEFQKSSNPAKFAYQTTKNYLESKKLNDPDYIKSVKEKMRNEILEELTKKQGAEKPQKSDIDLPDFTKASSSASGDKFPEEKTLEELFPPINKR